MVQVGGVHGAGDRLTSRSVSPGFSVLQPPTASTATGQWNIDARLGTSKPCHPWAARLVIIVTTRCAEDRRTKGALLAPSHRQQWLGLHAPQTATTAVARRRPAATSPTSASFHLPQWLKSARFPGCTNRAVTRRRLAATSPRFAPLHHLLDIRRSGAQRTPAASSPAAAWRVRTAPPSTVGSLCSSARTLQFFAPAPAACGSCR